MRDIHLHIHFDPADDRKLDRILHVVTNLTERFATMANEMEDLATQVAETKGAMQSAIVLIRGFGAALAAAGTDKAKLDALRADLKTDEDALAEAVAANPLPG